MTTNASKKGLLVGAIIAITLIIGGASGWFYLQYQQQNSNVGVTIRDFNYARDAQFILNIFKDNMYWLVAEGSDFSPEHMLQHLAWSKEPHAMGKETIKVLYENGVPAGFTAYYKLNFYKGRLHFLAVDEKFRSKGYGFMLVQYALKELIAQGSKEITLVTRTNNISAQNTYRKAGFKEGRKTDDGFVYFNYMVAE